MFKELDIFMLAKPIPNEPALLAGQRGVVLDVYGGEPCQYEVEFVNNDGTNIGSQATFALSEDFMTVGNFVKNKSEGGCPIVIDRLAPAV